MYGRYRLTAVVPLGTGWRLELPTRAGTSASILTSTSSISIQNAHRVATGTAHWCGNVKLYTDVRQLEISIIMQEALINQNIRKTDRWAVQLMPNLALSVRLSFQRCTGRCRRWRRSQVYGSRQLVEFPAFNRPVVRVWDGTIEEAYINQNIRKTDRSAVQLMSNLAWFLRLIF
jgi:hypothetical protein